MERAQSLTGARDWALQHPVIFVLLVALAVRVLTAVFVSVILGFDRDEFSDVRFFSRLAEQRADGSYHDWKPSTERYYDRFATYLAPLAVLYRVFGDYLALAQLLTVLAGTATAGIVCRLLLAVTTTRWALFGGLVVALFPSQVLWSSVGYRDSFVWMLIAAMALVFVVAARRQGWQLIPAGIALAGMVFLLGHLRWANMIVAAWALVIAALLSPAAGRWLRVVGAAVIVLVVPWYIGLGPGAIEYVADTSPSEVRSIHTGGETDIVDDLRDSEDLSGFSGRDLTHFPRGLSVMLFEPLPWTSLSGTGVRLAQLELVIWYPLLVVAAFGVPDLVRRRSVVAFPVVVGGTTLLMYALGEGNLGTALRHRAELVVPLAILSAFGAPVFLERWRVWSVGRRARVAASSHDASASEHSG